MVVNLTPEQETQLSQIATHVGTPPERLVTNVVTHYLDEEAAFWQPFERASHRPTGAS